MSTAAPEMIGRYRVLKLLGQGGMGAVYLAEDPILKRRLAVKVVLGAGASHDEMLERFRREAEISARLNHPHVITVYDCGDAPSLGPFLAMEFVDGRSLGELLRDGALSDAEARLRLLVQVMQALQAAHDAGIVHRDIKPNNIMVSKDGRAKLMDFGVARGADSQLTSIGVLLGTPAYMAPEQLGGSEPSAETDRYAFFVLAFEIFTGRRPFEGTTMTAMLYSIAHDPPVFPGELDGKIRSVFERALAKEPSLRFPDLRSFLLALAEACPLEPAARARIEVHLEPDLLEVADETVRLGREVMPAVAQPSRGVDSAPLAPPNTAGSASRMIEGSSVGTALLLGGGALAALTAAAVFAFFVVGRSPEPVPPAPRQEPAAAARQDEPRAPAVERDVRDERAPTPIAEPPAPVAPAPTTAATPPTPLVEERREEPAPLPSPPPVGDIERVPEPRAELIRRMRSGLDSERLSHVKITLDTRGDVVLADVVNADEAQRARRVVAEVNGSAARVAVLMRKRPPAAPARALVRERPQSRGRKSDGASSWGPIRQQGAERTD